MTSLKSALRSIDRTWRDSHWCCNGNGKGDHASDCQYARPPKAAPAPTSQTPKRPS
jgi:hypothetical protein